QAMEVSPETSPASRFSAGSFDKPRPILTSCLRAVSDDLLIPVARSRQAALMISDCEYLYRGRLSSDHPCCIGIVVLRWHPSLARHDDELSLGRVLILAK